MKTLAASVLAAVLSAPLAFAQARRNPGAARRPGTRHLERSLRPFQIDTGYFGLTADTLLRYQGPQGASGEISLEDDLGLNDRGRHVLAGRDVAGGPPPHCSSWASPGSIVSGRTTRCSATSRGAGNLLRRDECDHEQQQRHRRGLLPLRGLPQRPLRDRPHDRYRLPEARRADRGRRHRRWPERAGVPDAATRARAATAPPGPWGATPWPLRLAGSWCAPTMLYIKATPGGADAAVTDWRLGAYYSSPGTPGWAWNTSSTGTATIPGSEASKLSGQVTFQGVQVFVSFRF